MGSSVKQRARDRAVRALASARHRITTKLPSSTQVAPGVWIGQGVSGAHNVSFEGPNVVGRGTSFQGRDMSLGRGTTTGVGCIFNGPLSVGRYSQLGSYVGVYGVDHPTDVAVPNVNREFIGGAVKTLAKAIPVRIGHGCWIGHGAVVLRGVTIGNGAVVGAGCIVTADVPAYSVAVGVPAREPKPRFDPDLAEALEQIRWWTWSDEELEANQELFLTSFLDDPDRAAQLLAEVSGRTG